MDIKLLQQVLLRCAAVKRTPLIMGKHGIGKSAIVRSTFEELGYDVVDLRLGQMESGDLIGSPDIEYYCPRCGTSYGKGGVKECEMDSCVNKKSTLVGRTIWLAPSWFPRPGQKVVLFFDELNRGRQDVLQAVFQIVLDRRLHTHRIPDDVVIIAAGNPSGNDYNVEELDPALMDRFVVIKWTLKEREWLKWAREKNGKRETRIIPELIDFISLDPKYLGNESIDMELEIKPSPRAMEMLSDLLYSDGDYKIERAYWHEVASMVIGETAAIAFMSSLKTDVEKPVKAKEILDGFNDKIRKKIQAQVEANRVDIIKVTLDEVCNVLAEKSKDYSEAQLNNVGDFLLMIPQDQTFVALKEFSKNADVNTRLLLKRDDLFKQVMAARQSVGKK